MRQTRWRIASLKPESLTVVVQRVTELTLDDARLQGWVALGMAGLSGEVTVRLVGAEESADLNGRYRQKSGPTNVLSFPAEPLAMVIEDDLLPLGDLVLCVPVIAAEASQQGKTLEAHWAHLIIHGCLHLRGFDHQSSAEAEVMEAKECKLMASLGFADPYRAT